MHCLISLFYIKPQPSSLLGFAMLNCLISLFYIKPQLSWSAVSQCSIVLYLFSTSNHNTLCSHHSKPEIVLYLFSTSNHNILMGWPIATRLSYISFLHQTTTIENEHIQQRGLSYISFLHQTTTVARFDGLLAYCLISLFYIKPQRIFRILLINKHLLYIQCIRSGRNRLTTLQKY